jgi:iron complex outermembrane receptor protein
MRYRLLCTAAAWALSVAPAAAQSPAAQSPAARSSVDAPADTAAALLPELVVSSGAAELPGPDLVRVDAPTVLVQDPHSLADLGRLLPSVRTSVNSRGESLFTIRGAPDRHVQIYLDDLPLNLAWDERVDLETIPLTGSARVEGTRGLTTLLDGPGALAGSARLLPPETDGSASSRVSISVGTGNSGHTNVTHQNRAGPWQVLLATGWHGRDGQPLPEDLQNPQYDPDDDGRRDNSDLSQYAVFGRGARKVGDYGRLSVLAGGWTGEKGVPSEIHLGEDARFWRYPLQRRGLLGASLKLPLDEAGHWDLGAVVGADYYEQEIDPRGPDGWDTPLVDGQDYEHAIDRTGTARLRLDRWLGQDDRVSVLVTGRYAHHRESTVVGGGVLAYSQWIAGAVAEAELHPADGWRVRAGAGFDHAATPEAGDKTARAPDSAPALNLRVTRLAGRDTEIYAAASRRSRFPSLRELYSGALGRFVVNPELGPEHQEQFEIGAALRRPEWRLEAAAFHQRLVDGIERAAVPGSDTQFQRVNRGEITVPGAEAVLVWSPRHDVDVSLQHTVLHARVREAGQPDRPAEDRPDHLSRAAVEWRPRYGPRALVETVVTGPRWSADSTADDGLRRLPAGARWNVRVALRRAFNTNDAEFYGRIDNVFDAVSHHQTGLPEPGRVYSCGLALDF